MSVIRTYQISDTEHEERTVIDAILAICFPEETERSKSLHYTAPAQILVSEASALFSPEAHAASILNLGCVNVQTLSPSRPTNDPEPIISMINSKLETSNIYYRFAPAIQAQAQYLGRPNVLRTRTVIYFTLPAVSRKLEDCVDGFTSRVGRLTLTRLSKRARDIPSGFVSCHNSSRNIRKADCLQRSSTTASSLC
jgi:hypothetical protein